MHITNITYPFYVCTFIYFIYKYISDTGLTNLLLCAQQILLNLGLFSSRRTAAHRKKHVVIFSTFETFFVDESACMHFSITHPRIPPILPAEFFTKICVASTIKKKSLR